jgi:hypothetical protein
MNREMRVRPSTMSRLAIAADRRGLKSLKKGTVCGLRMAWAAVGNDLAQLWETEEKLDLLPFLVSLEPHTPRTPAPSHSSHRQSPG